jgi:outer membrane immunogenic protein
MAIGNHPLHKRALYEFKLAGLGMVRNFWLRQKLLKELKRMRMSVVSASVGLVLAATAANAQPFEGPYLGAVIGYGWTTAEADYRMLGFSSSLEEDDDGVAGGFFAGYSGVYGRLFGAIEGQGLLSAADQSRPANNITLAVEQRYTLGLMGKIGFLPIPKLLVYGTFGWAWTNFEATATDSSGSISDDDWFNGPRAGIGIEYAAVGNLFARLEYTHTWYGSNTYTDGIVTLDLEGDEDLFLVGIGYRF